MINRLIRKNFSKKLKNFINGEFVDSKTNQIFELRSPATNELISEVPLTPKDEFDNAVSIAKDAFKSWRNVPLLSRQRFMFDYLRLLKDNQVIFLNPRKNLLNA
jgi:malonate-semialdehyde dehydrogenase (acetylating)/methylmalonate-semialdehyde dehydrogenase